MSKSYSFINQQSSITIALAAPTNYPSLQCLYNNEYHVPSSSSLTISTSKLVPSIKIDDKTYECNSVFKRLGYNSIRLVNDKFISNEISINVYADNITIESVNPSIVLSND